MSKRALRLCSYCRSPARPPAEILAELRALGDKALVILRQDEQLSIAYRALVPLRPDQQDDRERRVACERQETQLNEQRFDLVLTLAYDQGRLVRELEGRCMQCARVEEAAHRDDVVRPRPLAEAVQALAADVDDLAASMHREPSDAAPAAGRTP